MNRHFWPAIQNAAFHCSPLFGRPARGFVHYYKPHGNWAKNKLQLKQNIWTLSLYNMGLYFVVFGFCFAMVPLYSLYCEHTGLLGDFKQKDYAVKARKGKLSSPAINSDQPAEVPSHLQGGSGPRGELEFRTGAGRGRGERG